MRFNFLFPFRDGPYGGANQFLKALREGLRRRGTYADDISVADVILFNSHHGLADVAKARTAFPRKIFIHRVDGPMRLYNEASDPRDAVVMGANRDFADATVFQSEWSRQVSAHLGFKPAHPVAVIGNASEPSIFNRDRSVPPLSGPKVRLIAASWSANVNKGFDVYEHLDSHLDFSRFEMTFVGNAPIIFRNIRHLAPCGSEEMAKHLKESDIFIAASRADPSSNALAEALSCGLPAVARHDGGHPELVGEGGLFFRDASEVDAAIDGVVRDYQGFVQRIRAPIIDDIAARYAEWASALVADREASRLSAGSSSIISRALSALRAWSP